MVTAVYAETPVVPAVLREAGSGRPGLLFTAVMVVTTVPHGITVRSISTRLVGAGVGGCQERTSLGSRYVNCNNNQVSNINLVRSWLS